jgi:hypothetical protein
MGAFLVPFSLIQIDQRKNSVCVLIGDDRVAVADHRLSLTGRCSLVVDSTLEEEEQS